MGFITLELGFNHWESKGINNFENGNGISIFKLACLRHYYLVQLLKFCISSPQ